MTKDDLITLVGRSLSSPLLRPLTQRLFRRRLPMIYYHGLWPKDSEMKRLFWGCDLDVFHREMNQLARCFRFISLDELLALNAAGKMPDDPVMAVGFDDGHDMFRSGALDVLDALRIPATVFVITKCIGNEHLMWMHALNAVWKERGPDQLLAGLQRVSEKRGLGTPCTLAAFPWILKTWPMQDKDAIAADIWQGADMPPVLEYLAQHRPYMSWDDLNAWMARGRTIGLHTATHPFCSLLSADLVASEIVAPAAMLRERFKVEKVALAYPFGERLRSVELERDVFERAHLSAMLGTGGLSRTGTAPWSIERVDAERGLDAHLFGRPLLLSAFNGA